MSPESKHEKFEKRAREVLEESTAKLDGRTLSRLTQSRHAALQQKLGRQSWRGWLTAGAAAAAVVVAVMVWTVPAIEEPGRPLSASTNGGSALEDIDLLADAPEFVGEGEDVEFYEWAADELES